MSFSTAEEYNLSDMQNCFSLSEQQIFGKWLRK